MLCFMWQCEERGYLVSGGKPWSRDRVAAAVGGDRTTALACITELIDASVVRMDNRGTMFSPRMVRDGQALKRDASRKPKRQSKPNPSSIRVQSVHDPTEKVEVRSQKEELRQPDIPREAEKPQSLGREVRITTTDPPGFAEAFAAIDAWALAARRLGLVPSRNEDQQFGHLLRERSTGPPIAIGGVDRPRLFAYAEAAGRLNRRGVAFKNFGWVRGCLDSEVNGWGENVPEESHGTANGSHQGAGGSTPRAGRTDHATERQRRRSGELPEPKYDLPIG